MSTNARRQRRKASALEYFFSSNSHMSRSSSWLSTYVMRPSAFVNPVVAGSIRRAKSPRLRAPSRTMCRTGQWKPSCQPVSISVVLISSGSAGRCSAIWMLPGSTCFAA